MRFARPPLHRWLHRRPRARRPRFPFSGALAAWMRRITVLVGAAAAIGCGSREPSPPSAPEDPLVVTVTGPAAVQGFDSAAIVETLYVCHVQLTETAAGGMSGQEASWGDSHYFFVRIDGTTYSEIADSAERFFSGVPTIETGTTMTGKTISVYWDAPFTLTAALYYSTPQTTRDSATYTFACQ
jgi:hypothetical protein